MDDNSTVRAIMKRSVFFFAFELYHSLFHILMTENSYRVDRAHFNFLFNSFEIL